MAETRETQIAVAREVDERLAKLWSDFYKARGWVNDQKKYVEHYERQGRMKWADEARGQMAKYQVRLDELRASISEIEESEYKGWNRFFLVKHIHKSQHCSSFRPATVIVWLPEVSGLTEVEAVEVYGKTLCTICFTTAPVE